VLAASLGVHKIRSAAAARGKIFAAIAAFRLQNPASVVRGVVLLAVAFGGGSIEAAAPKQTSAFGFTLGTSPHAAMALLKEQYQSCGVTQSIYHEVPGDSAQHTAALAINPGLTFNDIGAPDICAYSPAGSGITDAIEAQFVHPEMDRTQPLYSVEVQRLYPDVVYAQPARLRNSFDELRTELFRTYGRPIDERRERVASSAANLAASLGIGNNVKREDYLVRYLWATKGRLAETEYEDAACACEGRYVKAVIEISRSPSTVPKNKYYVLSVKLLVEDADLRVRQEAWNAQWQQQRK
jgi:hypothetical protein